MNPDLDATSVSISNAAPPVQPAGGQAVDRQGEWCSETVYQIRRKVPHYQADLEIANAHKTALAAERENATQLERNRWQQVSHDYTKALENLTAERQRAEQAERECVRLQAARETVIGQLLSALAAIDDCKTELDVLEYNITNKQWEFAKANVKSAARRLNVDLSLLHEHETELTEKVRQPAGGGATRRQV